MVTQTGRSDLIAALQRAERRELEALAELDEARASLTSLSETVEKLAQQLASAEERLVSAYRLALDHVLNEAKSRRSLDGSPFITWLKNELAREP